MHPELLERMLIKDKSTFEITNEIKLQVMRSVLFNESPIATFYFDYVPIEASKRFCLKI